MTRQELLAAALQKANELEALSEAQDTAKANLDTASAAVDSANAQFDTANTALNQAHDATAAKIQEVIAAINALGAP